jgi:hypothetical protein
VVRAPIAIDCRKSFREVANDTEKCSTKLQRVDHSQRAVSLVRLSHRLSGVRQETRSFVAGALFDDAS